MPEQEIIPPPPPPPDRVRGRPRVFHLGREGAEPVNIVYYLYLAALLLPVTALVGVIVAYVHRSPEGEAGTASWADSHYIFQIRTFWLYIFYTVVCVVLIISPLAPLAFLAIGLGLIIWVIIRCVRGLRWATRGEPHPDPESWWLG